MEKKKMHTPNLADENYRKLVALFPNAVTESIDSKTWEVVRSIDADVLRQEISGRVVERRGERYQFNMAGQEEGAAGSKRAHRNYTAACTGGQRGQGWHIRRPEFQTCTSKRQFQRVETYCS